MTVRVRYHHTTILRTGCGCSRMSVTITQLLSLSGIEYGGNGGNQSGKVSECFGSRQAWTSTA